MNKYANYFLEIISSIINLDFQMPLRYCTSCQRHTRFLVSGGQSRSIRCLSCKSTAISLATVAEIKKLSLDPNNSMVYEMSYHGAIYRYLKKYYSNFECSEYFGDNEHSKYVNGVRNEDVQKLSFEDGVFDLVSCTEVFEHVPDYLAGFSEISRVLRSGGWFVFTVPLFESESTEAVCRFKNNGELEWLLPEEFHDSQVTGVRSVPVFWYHSKSQILRDLLKNGFRYAFIEETNLFVPSIKQQVVVARK